MGLRETKKLATRQQIAGVAMRLFAMKGFDHVTVSEIAAEAGVSVKTVFNYFPTKEDLFFDEVPERLRRITEAIKTAHRARRSSDSLRGCSSAMHRACAATASPSSRGSSRTRPRSRRRRST
jgi:Transcriptional regulator